MPKKTAEDIAKDARAAIDKRKESKMSEKEKAEARDAAAASSAEKEKTRAEKEKAEKENKGNAVEKAEAQAKADTELLEAKDDTLDDEQKTRKSELVKKREESKKKGKQSNLDKRFGELSGQIKDLERDKNANKAEIQKLREEKDALEKKLNPPEVTEKEEVKKVEQTRIAKYLEEDKELPREDRRELTKDELDEWLSEDLVAAQEWMTERVIRRKEERTEYIKGKKANAQIDALLKKQTESNKVVSAKYPELDTTAVYDKLKAEGEFEGKTKAEINKIVLESSEKMKLATAIFKENVEKYVTSANGPELVMAELENRLKPAKKKTVEEGNEETTEERDARLREEGAAEERDRQERIEEGIDSTRAGERKGLQSEASEAQKRIAEKAGLSPERLKKSLERRSKIPGVTVFKD